MVSIVGFKGRCLVINSDNTSSRKESFEKIVMFKVVYTSYKKPAKSRRLER